MFSVVARCALHREQRGVAAVVVGAGWRPRLQRRRLG